MTFEFDRPSQQSLGAKTIAEGAIDNPGAVEVIADRVRDEILRHVEPSAAAQG